MSKEFNEWLDSLPYSPTPEEAWQAGRAALAAQQVPADTAILQLQEQKDGAYLERNRCVAALARMAIALGQRAGRAKTAIDGWDPAWHGCIYIDLPTGQVSWHYHESQSSLFNDLPEYTGRWDGHDTPTKYERLAAAFPVQPAVPQVPAVPVGYKLLKDTTHDERRWHEDAKHENGSYFNECVRCLRSFVGHKRRGVCRACAQPEAVPAQSAPQAPLDVCTDPDNCRRCRAAQWDKHKFEHAGIAAGVKEPGHE